MKLAQLKSADMLDRNIEDSQTFMPNIEICNVKTILNEIFLVLENKLQARGIVISYEPGGISYIKTDGRRLQQVLLNVLHNAVEFSYTGQKVKVKAKLRHVSSTAQEKKEELFLLVENTGPGMTENEIAVALGEKL